jgi:hypothetical protein
MEILSWTALFVALTPLVIAFLKRDDFTDNAVTILTLGVVVVFFFAGKGLDGGLTWPLPQSLAGELAQALIAQQVLYQLIKKTTPIKKLEAAGSK